MVMGFEAAIALSGSRVGAWDYQDATGRRLNLYAVGQAGAKLLGSYEFAPEAREATNARLRAAKLRVGGTHRDARYVWAMDETGATIWSDVGVVFTASSPAATEGRITRIVTFFGATDAGHRGVRAERTEGSTTIVEQHDPTPKNDPTYDQSELELDLEWAYYLGQDLALWLDVPHFDEFSAQVTNDKLRRIARGARELAAAIRGDASQGARTSIERSFGTMNDASDLVLRVVAEGTQYTVDIVATRAQSGAALTAAMKRGSREEVLSYLSQLRTSTMILQKMNALLDD